ncbi:hypothetical protein FPF80_01105 [Salmonella enterica subsp. enterica]|nr:hypothetical protein [Salmonella enterica subsp. enterica serovar Typhimurium]ECH1286372.1 hypothetical protein [Salmonella enterica subsp. enterica serovar Typhimurium]ECK0317837.1 hypothetical protein [Salmonella enterica subsp. enterica serovar Typhimurium]ECR1804277.1 hypothetical protein [Salmonella enterica subsp. enterica serovar Typhimurium]
MSMMDFSETKKAIDAITTDWSIRGPYHEDDGKYYALLRGEWPVGVSWNARKRLYQATIHNFEGRIKCLGYKDNPEDAHQLWLNEKIAIANKLKPLCESIHPNLFEGILRKIEMLSEGK